MPIIFDSGLLARREANTLAPADLCKTALCAALAQLLPHATVYSSAQAQGAQAPAVFVRFDTMQLRYLLGGLERMSLFVACRYLAQEATDDGENEEAMQALLDAAGQMQGQEFEFISVGKAAKRTADGALMTCEISFDFDRKNVAQATEGIMQMLALAALTQ